MIIKSIEYKNFRCFIDGKIEFDTKNKLNFIIGENGAGKTEMLFSFWWVLYDFDYKNLSNKKYTPYALNSRLYKELENSSTFKEYIAEVILEFEHNNRSYRLRRTRHFTKVNSKVKEDDYVELAQYDQYGVLSIPINDPKKCERALNSILPKKILSGILFDGERMRNLSSEDESSIKTIEGIISDITNQDAINMANTTLTEVGKNYLKKIKSIAKEQNNTELEELINKKGQLDQLITDLRNELEKVENSIPHLEFELDEVSDKLTKFTEVKIKEETRRRNEDLIDKLSKESTNLIQNFSTGLKFGYYLVTDNILEEVDTLINKSDVPFGLTSNAVLEIISRNKCICGEDLNDSHKAHLLALVDSLPPNNINATISEMTRQARLFKSQLLSTLQSDYTLISENDRKIHDLKIENAKISTEIGNGTNLNIAALEKQRINLNQSLSEHYQNEKSLINKLKEYKSDLDKINDQISSNSKSNKNNISLNKKYDFINKCTKLLLKIEEANRLNAMRQINEYLDQAYSELSDDYSKGRRLYITRFTEPKYRIIPYYFSTFQKHQNNIKDILEKDKYKKLGKIDDQTMNEILIIESAESNSTGQGKVNTLSFIKSLMKYSKSNRTKVKKDIESIMSEEKHYPLILDAPFTELSEYNLSSIARKLKDFNEQTIVMLDKKSFEDNLKYYSEEIGAVYQLVANDNLPESSIRRIENGNTN